MSDDQYLDGFRDGLGAAVRAIDSVRAAATHPAVCHALIRSAPDEATIPDIVDAALRGMATGIRMLSASVRLDDGPTASNSPK